MFDCQRVDSLERYHLIELSSMKHMDETGWQSDIALRKAPFEMNHRKCVISQTV